MNGDPPSLELDPELKSILERLIHAGILATRERYDLEHDDLYALSQFDGEAHTLARSGFYTNLHLGFRPLENQAELLALLSRYICSRLAQTELDGVVSLQSFRGEDEAVGVIRRLIRDTRLPEVPVPSRHQALVLMAGIHSQELVDFWRKHDAVLKRVLVLFGTSRRHVQDELNLPAEKYIALVSRDTLEQVDPQVRHQMIPLA